MNQRLGQFEEAAEQFEKALALQPQYGAAKARLAKVRRVLDFAGMANQSFGYAQQRFKQQRWNESAAAFSTALELGHPMKARCHYGRGLCFMEMTEGEEKAYGEFSAAVKADGADAPPLYRFMRARAAVSTLKRYVAMWELNPITAAKMPFELLAIAKLELDSCLHPVAEEAAGGEEAGEAAGPLAGAASLLKELDALSATKGLALAKQPVS